MKFHYFDLHQIHTLFFALMNSLHRYTSSWLKEVHGDRNATNKNLGT